MSSTISSVAPLIVQSPNIRNNRDQIVILNPNERYFDSPASEIIRRTYLKPSKSKYHYRIDQGGKSYRCCQWCRYWCTRRCPMFDFCDRILACPLLFFILSGLLLLCLFIGLLTLLGLDPAINGARRYYGVIRTLSIVNSTKYIFKLDQLCSSTSFINGCLDIVTSTAIVNVATTVTINQTAITVNYSSILLVACLIIFCFHRKVFLYTV